jgi:hypothetical protein
LRSPYADTVILVALQAELDDVRKEVRLVGQPGEARQTARQRPFDMLRVTTSVKG